MYELFYLRISMDTEDISYRFLYVCNCLPPFADDGARSYAGLEMII